MSSVLEILSINELYIRRDNLLKQLKKVDDEIAFRKIDIPKDDILNITPKQDIPKDNANITTKDDIKQDIPKDNANITTKDDIPNDDINIIITSDISNIIPIECNKSLKKIKITIKKTIKS